MARSQRGGERQGWGRVRGRQGRAEWPQRETPGEQGRGGEMGYEIRTGKPQVRPSKPSHVAGVREGNAPGSYKSQPGHLADGTSTARRSTGINAKHRDPIDPSSPNLSPA
jgi:hypothetical protein